jgi:SAM-dependent methyltransferase
MQAPTVKLTEPVTRLPPELRCLKHLAPFEIDDSVNEATGYLICSKGCRTPIVDGVPRFVDSSNYASAFGLQWKLFAKTQLDSHTGTTIFRDRLRHALGGSLDILRHKSVLEAGCGAGAFTEVLLDAGARVFATDLSNAVEANYANHGHQPNYFVCQANILSLPVAPASFDIVVCLGVVQHTPDPETTLATLARYVKPGGLLVIDHYGLDYPYNLSRKILRPLLMRLPGSFATKLTLAFSRGLLQLHKLTWNNGRGVWRLRVFLQRHSPLVDHYDDYPQLQRDTVAEWSVLNTHDTLLDRYKHLRSVEQIRDCLSACGLKDIAVYRGGNGVEARARVPRD